MSLNSSKLQQYSLKAVMATRLCQARGDQPQKKVTQVLGISQPVLSKMEHGRRVPSALELKKLADFYKKPLSFFFDKEQESTQTSTPTTVWKESFHYPVPVTPELLQTIVQRIIESFQPQRVVLFGSHAWGEPRPESDVDFLVVTKTLSHLRPAHRRFQVKRICQPPFVSMDVLVYAPEEIRDRVAMGDLFLPKILAEGKILYDKPPG